MITSIAGTFGYNQAFCPKDSATLRIKMYNQEIQQEGHEK